MMTTSSTEVETIGTVTTTDVRTYTGSDAPVAVWDIDQLKNKEMIVIWDGTSTDSSTSSSKGSMTFTQ